MSILFCLSWWRTSSTRWESPSQWLVSPSPSSSTSSSRNWEIWQVGEIVLDWIELDFFSTNRHHPLLEGKFILGICSFLVCNYALLLVNAEMLGFNDPNLEVRSLYNCNKCSCKLCTKLIYIVDVNATIGCGTCHNSIPCNPWKKKWKTRNRQDDEVFGFFGRASSNAKQSRVSRFTNCCISFFLHQCKLDWMMNGSDGFKNRNDNVHRTSPLLKRGRLKEWTPTIKN